MKKYIVLEMHVSSTGELIAYSALHGGRIRFCDTYETAQKVQERFEKGRGRQYSIFQIEV